MNSDLFAPTDLFKLNLSGQEPRVGRCTISIPPVSNEKAENLSLLWGLEPQNPSSAREKDCASETEREDHGVVFFGGVVLLFIVLAVLGVRLCSFLVYDALRGS